MADRTDTALDLVIAALSQASHTTAAGVTFTRPAGLAVLDQELEPVETFDLPAAGVYPLKELVQHAAAAPPVTDRDITFAVEVRAAVVGSAAPRAALSPVRTWVIVSVMNYQPLKDFVRDLPHEIGTEWDNGEQRHVGVASCTSSFRLRFRTRYGDPTAI